MLDIFVIFGKSGIVLFTTVNKTLNNLVNGLIKHVFLEERIEQYHTDQLQFKYALDNEFELVYVVGYQKSLTLSYVDKFLDDIQLAFRDKYANLDLHRLITRKRSGPANREALANQRKRLDFCDIIIDDGYNIIDFSEQFVGVYRHCVKAYQSVSMPKPMRSFEASAKSQKTVASIIVKPAPTNGETNKASVVKAPSTILSKIISGAKPKSDGPKPKKTKPFQEKKKGKAARQWELNGSNPDEFDFSKRPSENAPETVNTASIAKNTDIDMRHTSLELSESSSSSEDEEDSADGPSYLSSLWGKISNKKAITQEDLKPILANLKDHLTSKNVATEVAEKLCESVAIKLEGQQLTTWMGLKSLVKKSLEESLLRILTPNRVINILRDIQAKPNPPYVIVFCGVNGVGKSTNLAKIANWLMSNKMRVLIIACDTFRAGAIEQLRTHVQALKSTYDDAVELFERGYGKDSAGIAMEGINYARSRGFNCVLIDTAGRMQDNEPLMRQLAKLIKVNVPDLTLFVGEALVGNEAVDQLTKFNNALIDCGCHAQDSTRSAINGIVLTKFDTIDDKVGAAISMTYVTGQPIVFVGVGQTYRDLKQLDAKFLMRSSDLVAATLACLCLARCSLVPYCFITRSSYRNTSVPPNYILAWGMFEIVVSSLELATGMVIPMTHLYLLAHDLRLHGEHVKAKLAEAQCKIGHIPTIISQYTKHCSNTHNNIINDSHNERSFHASTFNMAMGRANIRLPHDVNRILYVTNLPYNLKADELYEIFGKFGAIRQIRVGSTSDSKGRAFVVYEDIFDAKNAYDHLNGFNVCGRYIVLQYFKQSKSQPEPRRKVERQTLDALVER
ncbi:Signal recognition particle receptor subunit alpha [Fragariocoptes setiger]|uniref:Signal recognition particle receptor subunit alpha n=1 Tax=Fragariocoptes setiger TaxID=1670756 RepID=A0ABQ7S711_9ACAR|nr:Signal recognition particle receptor subunit alpha [Fragariocoptes setiger]